VSIAQTLISTYESAVKSYNAMAGIPIVGPGLGVAAAAAAVLAGMAQVQNIRKMSIDGGGGGGEGGGYSQATGTGTVPPLGSGPLVPTPVEGTQQITHVTVNVHNPLSTQNWAEIVELDIVPALRSAADRGVTINT
jgi:hypothetical protein